MKTALTKARVPRRALMWLCVAALLISLMPLYALSFYNHACYDDFGFSILTHAAWRDTGSLAETLKAAVRNTVGIRDTWEGTYATSFLSALQPAVFGEGLYWVATALLLTYFLFALWLFLREALRRGLGADGATFWTAYCCVAFVMIQFVPDLSEAFFWFNGGVAYTFLWSVMLTRLAVWLRFRRAARTGARAALYALLLLLTVVVGGGKYPTLLFACLCDVALVAEGFAHKRGTRWAELALPLLLGACLLFSATAPGNGVRAATLGATLGAPKAVLEAAYFGLALMGHWFSLPLAVVWALVAWQLAEAIRGCPFRFNHPLWITLLCVGLFCAQLAPTLYTGNYLGDGRAMNTYFYTFVLMSCALALYWEGWLLRRLDGKPRVPAIPTGAGRGLKIGALLAALVLLAVGCACWKPDGASDYSPWNTAAGSAVRALTDGTAARYDAQMDERDRAMNDASQPEVVMRPVTDIPAAFMGDALDSDSRDYVLSLYAEYYQKQAVTAEEEEEPADAAP